MIYTLTLNPSLDYYVYVDDLEKGKTNRSKKEFIFPGGKGINVSLVLKNLGADSIALGFPAGFSGKEIESLLIERGIQTNFIFTALGLSRINVKIKGKEETEINGNGPMIEEGDILSLLEKLDDLKDNDVLILSGSVPGSLSSSVYSDILKRISSKKVITVVDTTGDALLNTLPYHPFLIKPNNFELEEIFNVPIKSKDSAIEYAKKLCERGAENVLVSLAGDGAVLVSSNGKVFVSAAPYGKVVNSVGAGDSMVAGFIHEYLATKDLESAFIKSVCAGSASAFSEGMATIEDINELYNQFNHI